MKTIVVDYSETYYLDIAKTTIPERYAGKFVQIRHKDTEYIIFSPKELTKYHADLVERFCLENGLNGDYDSGHKRFDIHDPAWKIIGGGKFELDRAGKQLRLYDDSMAYGKFDVEGLEERIKKGNLSDYRIEVQ